MDNNKINILLSSNEKYLKYADVLITSILENNRNVCIYYVYSDKPSEMLKEIENEVLERGGEIKFVKPDNSLFSTFPKTSEYFSIEEYYTLFPHLYLPTDIDRILYLDIDTIVTKDLAEFYNTDFEDNFLIAAGHVPNVIPKEPFDEERKCKGEYFNSGVIIYNLNKLRQEISANFYAEVLRTSQRFFFDQGMLNYLFCHKTKYVDTMKYCYRFYIAKKYPQYENEPDTRSIIHYICRSSPYKPWDLYLTDEELDRLKNIPSFESGNFFYIDKFINDMNGIWWEYAHKCKFGDLLYREMLIKKEYILRFGIPNRINSNYSKAKELEKRYKLQENIKKSIVKKNVLYNDLAKITSVEEYFNELAKEEKYITFITCCDTASTYYKKFIEMANLQLPDIGFRESFIAVLNKNELLFCDKGMGILIKEMRILSMLENKGIVIGNNVFNSSKLCTIISQGYDEKDKTSIASIIIDNYDYSINKIGLNFVVYDRRKMAVVDMFRINTHKDSDIKIDRS